MTAKLYQQEIREQPDILRRLLKEAREQVEAVAASVRARPPTYGLLAARGSSDNAARYAQYIWGVNNELTCALAAPSLLSLYSAAPRMHGSLTVGISQSGQSPDIVAILKEASLQGAMTVAITNDPASPLAEAASHCIELRAGVEQAIAATKTYTAQLFVLAMISAAVADSLKLWSSLALVPELVAQTIEMNADRDWSAELGPSRRFLVVGRGFNYSTAFELALKIKETSYLVAEPYSSADFLHGPVATMDENSTLLLVAPDGARDRCLPMLLRKVEETRARLIAISNDEAILARSHLAVRLPAMPEWISPVAFAVASQLLAGALAALLGEDPDRPRGLSKVVQTF